MLNYTQLVAQNNSFAYLLARRLMGRPERYNYGQDLIVQYDFDKNGKLIPSFPQEETDNSFTLYVDSDLIEYCREDELINDIASQYLFVIASEMAEELEKD